MFLFQFSAGCPRRPEKIINNNAFSTWIGPVLKLIIYFLGLPLTLILEGVGPFYAPPLKSPKSNIFGQGKLGWAITNYQKAEKNLQKYAQKNIFDKIFFQKYF